VAHLALIRGNVVEFMKRVAKQYATHGGRLLDIAPQDHEGARPFFNADIAVDTFDIDPDSGCTFIGDICQTNACLAEASYDYVVCTEVLEHTFNPAGAVQEIWRVLKPGGMLFLTVPFNFRIHGPLPDCWRFTEHGLRHLLASYHLLELNALETPDRPLMPVHYSAVAQVPRG
jgi:SAM-dependent methyltransferase